MNRWRIVIVTLVILALLSMVLSALFFDSAWWRRSLASLGAERAPHKAWRLALLQDVGVRANLASLFANLVTLFLFGVLTLYLAPGRIRHIAQELSTSWQRFVRFFAVGVLIMIFLSALGLLSLLTVQTMPLPIILGMVFLLAALSGMVALAYQLGKTLLIRAEWTGRSPLLSLALGTLILFALTNVPYFGGVLLILILLTGAGLSITTRFGSGKPWTLGPLMEDVRV
jgi:hypothetical protein